MRNRPSRRPPPVGLARGDLRRGRQRLAGIRRPTRSPGAGERDLGAPHLPRGDDAVERALRELSERVARLERELSELRGAADRARRGGGVMSHAALLLASTSDTATGVGIPLALAAGLVSFLSPCVLPIVPGYLSTVIGVTPNDLKEGVGLRRVLVPSLLFIASFSLIFILLGLSATVIGSTLNDHKQLLERIGGGVIIALGAIFLATPVRQPAQP